MSETKGNILIVDDTAINLQLLGSMLKDAGYKARPVPSGELALKAAAQEPPDLVLLDINMPGMDGYTVCARLKADPRLRAIPVIFISALSETAEKVKAFEVGGVDYVTKPFQEQEVKARVETHLTLRRLQLDLERRYEELKQLQDLRDNLTHMIVHDLRSPLTGLIGFLELLKLDIGKLDKDGKEYLNAAMGTTRTVVEMISSLLDVTRLESGQMPVNRTDTDLSKSADEALKVLSGLTVDRNVSTDTPDGAVRASCDADLMRRVITNLVANALKFTPEQGTVTVTVRANGGRPRVEVRDTGRGIPEEFHGKIFEKFGQVDAARQRTKYSTGLGLTFCKLAVEAHGGTIGVNSKVGEGSTFWFELP